MMIEKTYPVFFGDLDKMITININTLKNKIKDNQEEILLCLNNQNRNITLEEKMINKAKSLPIYESKKNKLLNIHNKQQELKHNYTKIGQNILNNYKILLLDDIDKYQIYYLQTKDKLLKLLNSKKEETQYKLKLFKNYCNHEIKQICHQNKNTDREHILRLFREKLNVYKKKLFNKYQLELSSLHNKYMKRFQKKFDIIFIDIDNKLKNTITLIKKIYV